jgi:hypothetical protein
LRHQSHKKLIPKTAFDLGISEEMVSDMIDVYWKDLKSKMRGLKDPVIKVTRLGNFFIKPWSLDKMLGSLRKHLESKDTPRTFGRMINYQEIQEKLTLLENVKMYYEEEDKKFKLILEKRYGKQPNKDMEK